MIIANPGYVLRSTTPVEHARIHAANIAKANELFDASQAYCREIVPESTPYGWMNDAGATVLEGFTDVPYGAVLPGFLRCAKRGVWVPRKKDPRGQEIAKKLSSFNFKPESMGSVDRIIAITNGLKRWLCSATIEAVGDEVYATYFYPIDDRQDRDKNPTDRARVLEAGDWVEAPLSEFYAAREAASSDAA